MKNKASKKSPETALRDGTPAAVILDINEYQEMLERLEDIEDLEMLRKMRTKQLSFRELNESLASAKK